MSNDKIRTLVMSGELTLTDVIDAVIELNGLVGVGLISLADDVSDYITGKVKPVSQAVLEGA